MASSRNHREQDDSQDTTPGSAPHVVRKTRPWPVATPADPVLSAWCAVAQERIDGYGDRLDEFQRDIKEDIGEVKTLLRGSGLTRRAMDHAAKILGQPGNVQWCVVGLAILAILMGAGLGLVKSVQWGVVGINTPPAVMAPAPAPEPSPGP